MDKLVKGRNANVKPIVFVVDDEVGYTDIMRDVLEQYGLEVHISNGAFEAMQIMGWMTPDLILLDIMMPSVDGITLLRHLRRDQNMPKIPILVVSAHPETREEALAAGADGYLAKPFTAQELRSTISQYVEVSPQA
ncbi:MAG: response regulator [Anaerolineales bacterium]